jgi:hypothetical protein
MDEANGFHPASRRCKRLTWLSSCCSLIAFTQTEQPLVRPRIDMHGQSHRSDGSKVHTAIHLRFVRAEVTDKGANGLTGWWGSRRPKRPLPATTSRLRLHIKNRLVISSYPGRVLSGGITYSARVNALAFIQFILPQLKWVLSCSISSLLPIIHHLGAHAAPPSSNVGSRMIVWNLLLPPRPKQA